MLHEALYNQEPYMAIQNITKRINRALQMGSPKINKEQLYWAGRAGAVSTAKSEIDKETTRRVVKLSEE